MEAYYSSSQDPSTSIYDDDSGDDDGELLLVVEPSDDVHQRSTQPQNDERPPRLSISSSRNRASFQCHSCYRADFALRPTSVTDCRTTAGAVRSRFDDSSSRPSTNAKLRRRASSVRDIRRNSHHDDEDNIDENECQTTTTHIRWSSSCSWIRLIAVSLLVVFSLASIIPFGHCHSINDATAPLSSSTMPMNNYSGSSATIVNGGDRSDPKKARSQRVHHPRSRHSSVANEEGGGGGGGNWALGRSDDDLMFDNDDGGESEKQKRLSKAAFRQLSRMAFKALISEDFQDRPLRPPEDEDATAATDDRHIDGLLGTGEDQDSELTPEARRQIRKQHRKLQRQRHRQLRRRQQAAARRLNEDEDEIERGRGGGGNADSDLLPPPSDYNQRELIEAAEAGNDDDGDSSSQIDQTLPSEHRLPGRRRAMAIATKDSIKPDSCRTVPLKQRVRMTGCVTKIVVNNFCYGQCNSFYIPKLSKKRLRAAFESCSVCRPKSYVPVAITLHCPTRNPPYIKRKIMKVKECSCMPANISDNDIPQP